MDIVSLVERVPGGWHTLASVALELAVVVALVALAARFRSLALALAAVRNDVRKQTARIDRMQRDAQRRSDMAVTKRADWGDSLDLTRFDWKKPES